jgi:hypothetical protein
MLDISVEKLDLPIILGFKTNANNYKNCWNCKYKWYR